MSLAAPVGEQADWSVRGALTQGDISSWFMAGAYTTRAPARHRYDLGLSYSTQRYDGGNPAALREVTDGSRNVGVVYGFDTFTITPASIGHLRRALLALRLPRRGTGFSALASALTVSPVDGLRISARVSSRALAPGAEEFLPPADSGSGCRRSGRSRRSARSSRLQPERTTQVAFSAERDLDALGASTVSLRVFRQHVADQLVTLFGDGHA